MASPTLKLRAVIRDEFAHLDSAFEINGCPANESVPAPVHEKVRVTLCTVALERLIRQHGTIDLYLQNGDRRNTTFFWTGYLYALAERMHGHGLREVKYTLS